MTQIWLNGYLQDSQTAKISPTDRGFLLADGVFETIRTSGKNLIWFDDHLNRLKTGAALLGIPLPLSDEEIRAGLASLLAQSGLEDGALRLTLTRGPSQQRGLWPADEVPAPTLLASISARITPSPARIIVARSTRRNEFSPLSQVKYLGYGDAIIARREALAAGASDALLRNCAGTVACATIGNIFLRIDDQWITPPLGDGALPGLARARLIELLTAQERSITEQELDKVQTGLISNSLGLTPLSHLQERALSPCAGLGDLEVIYRE